MVATGKTDWVRDVADEKGSVMQAVGKSSGPTNGVSAAEERERPGFAGCVPGVRVC